MKLLRFEDPLLFQERVNPVLVRHEAENNLPLGIIANLIAGEYREHPPYLAAVEDRGKIELAVLRTPPFPALFSYRDPLPGQEIIRLVLADLWDVYGADLSGITANQPLAETLVESWVQRSGLQAKLDRSLRIYKLETVRAPQAIPGELQLPAPGDRALLEKWYAEFNLEALGEEQTADHVQKQVDQFLTADPGQRGIRIWKVEGRSVSMAGYSGPTPHGIRVGAVYTPRENRQQGYASACVAALSQELLDAGFAFCFLFTDLQNPTSNHIYQELGYRPVVDVDSFHFRELDQAAG